MKAFLFILGITASGAGLGYASQHDIAWLGAGCCAFAASLIVLAIATGVSKIGD
jgi:hypothetical protein